MGNASNPAFRLLDETDDHPGARVRRIGGLTLWAETLAVRTTAARQFLDVTDQVAAVVQRSRISQGWVSAFSKHTTAAVVLQENEPLLLQDMGGLLERLSAAGGVYQHNDLSRRTGEMDPDECANGHAHCQQPGYSGRRGPPRPRPVAADLSARARPRARPPIGGPGLRRLTR